MKRKNWFTTKVAELGWIKILTVIVSGLVWIFWFGSLFTAADKVPATQADYEPLEKQVADIQQNPELLLETEGNIVISDKEIIVEIENEECKIIANYDKNFNLLKTQKADKSSSILEAILMCAVLSGLFAFFVGMLLNWILSGVKFIVIGICKKLKTPKEVNN